MCSASTVDVFDPVVVSGVVGRVQCGVSGLCVSLVQKALMTSVCGKPSRLAFSSGELRSSCRAS